MTLKKRLLLLNPPGDKLYSRDKYCNSISKADYYWTPLDLLCLSGHLAGDFELVVLDAIASNINFTEARGTIKQFSPHVVISLTSAASWKQDFAFFESIKSLTGCVLLLSGGFLLSQGRQAMEEYPFIDGCILDFTTDDTRRFLMGERNINNMIYRHQHKVIETPRSPNIDFSMPIPRHSLFPIKKYRYPISIHSHSTCVISSFGCPFHCSFCVPATLPYKLRKIDNTIEELAYIQSLGIKEVVFQDSTFTANRSYALELCDAIIKNGIELDWICLTRVDCIDKELLLSMKRAGCHSIEFGVESSDENILTSVKKHITPAQTRSAFQLCRQSGIRTCAFFILGLPGQDEASISRTTEFAIQLKPDVVSFSLPMPHAGTMLGESMLPGRNTIIQYDDSASIEASSNMVPKEVLLKLRNAAYKRFYFRPAYIIKHVLSLRSFAQFKLEFSELLSLIRNYV